MRALHLIKTSVGATWALRQVRELVKLGVEVHVALPPAGPMVGRYAEVGASEHLLNVDLPIRSPWQWPLVKRNILVLLKRVKPDIVHSHFVGTTLAVRLALGKAHPTPRIFQVPGPLHLEHPIFRKAEIATAGKPDRWVGSCRWTCRRYQKSGVDRSRIFISHYGTDLSDFTVQIPGKLRRELGLQPNTKVIGMVAYMYAPKRYLGQSRGLKGHEDLIDALALCLPHIPDLVCVIVGGAWNGAGSYERRVHDYARRKCGDRVVFLGTRSDVPELYPDFDVVVHPSLSENVGGAVESLLSAVPTIATDVGGFPDIVRPGETGWRVPPSNPARLAQTIVDVLKDPLKAKQTAASGKLLAQRIFDVRKTAKEILAIYNRILSLPGPIADCTW